MSEKFYTILTNAGKAKIANASTLGTKVTFTHFALGDGGGSYYNPTENQKNLVNEVWRGKIGSIAVDKENPNWIVIEIIIPASVGGFMIREAGVFDDEGNLLAVGKYPETYKPTVENGSAKDLYVRMIFEVSNTSVINLKVDPTVILATKKDIDILSDRIIKNENDIVELKEGSTEITDLQTENKTLAGAINEVKVEVDKKETPDGAQKKANETAGAALEAANSYTDQSVRDLAGNGNVKTVKGLDDELAEHKAENVHQFENVNTQLNTIDTKLSNTDNFKSDYEYQTPTIIGRQIQLQKLSDTNIIKFRLNEDIPEGTQITISLDGGATSKVLVDVENTPIAELKKGFVEVINDDVNFTLRPRGASLEFIDKPALLMETESAYASNVLLADDEYLYIYTLSGGTYLHQFNKSDLVEVRFGTNYADVKAITQDSNFIYAGGSTPATVVKINKYNLSKTSESISYGIQIRSLDEDSQYIYVGGVITAGESTSKVWKLNKTNLTKIAESPSYGKSISNVVADEDYIYIGGASTKIWKLNKSDLSIVASSPILNATTISHIVVDSDTVYAVYDTHYILSLNKSDMTIKQPVMEHPSGIGIATLAQDEKYLYLSSGSMVEKMDKDTFEIVSVSTRRLSQIIEVDNNYIYTASITANNSERIGKFAKQVYIQK